MNSMPTPPTAYDETAKGPGLSGLLEILGRRRVLAVLPFLFVLTAAVSLAVFLPSLWTAPSLVLVNRQAIPERAGGPQARPGKNRKEHRRNPGPPTTPMPALPFKKKQ